MVTPSAKTKRKNRIKEPFSDQIFNVFNVIIMLFVLVITLYPFWDVLVSSVSKVKNNFGLTLWPKNVSFDAYRLMFEYKALWTAYGWSIIRTVLVVIIGVFLTALTAYPLSKKKLPLIPFFTFVILLTMLFGRPMIAEYMLFKELKLINNFWVMIVPGALVAYYVLITRNFFQSIPDSLEESASIDGASWFRIFLQIILPLSMPVLATVGLWKLLEAWNDWYTPTVYIPNMKIQVVQQILRRYIIENDMSSINSVVQAVSSKDKYSGRMLESTTIVAASVPILLVYPLLQKYFAKGIMLGSVKG